MSEKILIVDDDQDFREELKDFLSGYMIQEAASGSEALAILKRAHDIDLVLLDVNMPGPSGLDVLSEIKKRDPELAIIILTGNSTKDVAIEALKSRADDYIEKPMDPQQTRKIIERVLEKKYPEGNPDTADMQSKIEKVKRFVERNCFRKTALEDAARSVCLSSKYLSRVFKEQFGESFSAYKLKIKIGKAKDLLLKGGYNVNQLAEKLGYENTESFIRQFKKLTGYTPVQFRNARHKKKLIAKTRHVKSGGKQRRK